MTATARCRSPCSSFELSNTTGEPIDYTLAGTLGNYGNNSGVHSFATSQRRGVADASTSSDPDEARGASRRPHHRHRQPRRAASGLSLSRPVVRRPHRVLEGLRQVRPADRAALRHAARHRPHAEIPRARHARRQDHRPGRRDPDRPLRHLVELSRTATSTGPIATSPTAPVARQADAARGRTTTRPSGPPRWSRARDAFARWADLGGQDPQIPRHACSARPMPRR